MIVGTAGHIDHGKTTLVRALTGVDTDRLPEEKARGISIELGYAFLDVPGHAASHGPAVERIGFIDVPGHERLVHTMLAGATGIDFALLLVAADDGVMPQTREHLAVLSLLGIANGVIVVTKADRVDTDRLVAVAAEVEALTAGSSLRNAPVLNVAATTGQGIETLRELLLDAARRQVPRRNADAAFRLAVDRVFTLAGIGTVATGTVHAGRVAIGDELALLPSGAGHSPLIGRVRSLHAQNQPVQTAIGGQRCAVALGGVSKEQIARGQWLVAPGTGAATDRLDAEIVLWHEEKASLRSGTPVRVHIGASDVLGTVAVLAVDSAEVDFTAAVDANDRTASGGAIDRIPPGGAGTRHWVQLVLREPIGAWHGDRVVLRDTSASRTLAGGRVLDPFAPARYRRTPQRLAELAAWGRPDAVSRLRRLIDAAPFGVSLRRWALAEGRSDASAADIFPVDALISRDAARGDWALGAEPARSLGEAVLSALRSFHAREPEMLGPDAAQLRRLGAPRLPEPLWAALLASLQHAHRLAKAGPFVHLPEHGLKLSATDERLAQRIAPALASAGFEGSWARDLARDANESEALLRMTLNRLAQRGELHQVIKDLCYPPQTMLRLAAIVRSIAESKPEPEPGLEAQAEAEPATGLGASAGTGPRAECPAGSGPGAVTAAAFRDATGLGRKRAIQLLEYFDRIGMLRRVGDTHRLRHDTSLFLPDETV